MKARHSLLLIGLLPALALAAGEHGGGHGAGQMQGMTHVNAAGRPGDPAKVTRTIEVTMNDTMRFIPGEIKVKAGETIRFFVKNSGKIAHEMLIGSMEELKHHAAEMRSKPAMKHADPSSITLEPGKRGGIVWQFDQPGSFSYGCMIPGHFEAGMVGKVDVM